MSRRIGIIAEDKSDVEVVNIILGKYMPSNTFSIKHFTGGGCGKLKNKCHAWADLLIKNGCEHILIFHDRDKARELELRRILESKVPKSIFPNSVIIIPVEEIEGWLLSDIGAISKVFSFDKIPKIKSFCELIDSPKEYIQDMVKRISGKRYIHTHHNKIIAQNISLDNLRKCKSFTVFDEYVLQNLLT